MRESRLKSEHGLSREDYEVLAELQEHACAVCQQPEEATSASGAPLPLAVDHCHRSGKLGLLLCMRCNTAIGLLRDDPEVAARAAEYLRLHRPAS